MAGLAGTFGIAVQNFTAYPQMPDAKALVEYGVRMEQLGFDSLWVWDHILLGVEPNFPIIESLTLLTAIAARTNKIKLGTGILVLPMRNPVILAKQLASMDLLSDGRLLMGMASGWYRREFNAIGVPFEQRGKIMDENLDLLKRFWTEPMVSAKVRTYDIPAGVMFPKPVQKPHPPILIGGYVDRVLKRAAVSGDGWLTYFYRPESFAKSWDKIRGFAKEAGKDPDTLLNASQLPIFIGKSRQAVESQMVEWLTKEWDFASWSESTKESAIMGTVDECVEQLRAHVAVGTQKIILFLTNTRWSRSQLSRADHPRLRQLNRIAYRKGRSPAPRPARYSSPPRRPHSALRCSRRAVDRKDQMAIAIDIVDASNGGQYLSDRATPAGNILRCAIRPVQCFRRYPGGVRPPQRRCVMASRDRSISAIPFRIAIIAEAVDPNSDWTRRFDIGVPGTGKLMVGA